MGVAEVSDALAEALAEVGASDAVATSDELQPASARVPIATVAVAAFAQPVVILLMGVSPRGHVRQ